HSTYHSFPTRRSSDLLQVYLGSQYVNDFNYLGRTYEVVVQADWQFRRTPQDIARLKARNASGEMVPIGTVAQLRNATIPYRVPRDRKSTRLNSSHVAI